MKPYPCDVKYCDFITRQNCCGCPEMTEWQQEMKEFSEQNIKFVRPSASVDWSNGNDGRDGYYYIRYACPTCKTPINGYKGKNACEVCGTFFDWGNRQPRIKIERTVEW